MDKPGESEIRHEIAESLDRLAELEDGALGERLRLRTRLDELRSMLQALDIDGAAEIKARWAGRAGSKPDYDPERSVIASPSIP